MSVVRDFPDLPPVWMLGHGFAAWGLAATVPLVDFAGPTARWIGATTALAGIALAVWAAAWFARRRTTIEPREAPAALIVEGPFRVNRNPIYTGMALVLRRLGAVAGRADGGAGRARRSSLRHRPPLRARRGSGAARGVRRGSGSLHGGVAALVSPDDLDAAMRGRAARVERVMEALLGEAAAPGETHRPPVLLAAMRHGSLGGGKRLRPFLLAECARLCGAQSHAVDRVAAALELVHCYSLVHDDLPAMDDDALRRGRPTVHVAYDEATAILAGDALMTLAYDVIASDETALPGEVRARLVSMLARASGVGGMGGGQMLDLLAEREAPGEAGIVRLQAMKTGALIRFACEGGAVAAGADGTRREALRRYGETIGLAFQLADDLLDVTQSAEAMGKATGKDAGAGKGTLVGLHGIGWTRARLDALVAEAGDHLAPFGADADTLRATARFVALRDH